MKIKWNVTFSHGWWPSMNNSSARNQIKTLTKFVSNVCGRASRDRSWNSIGISQKNSHSLWRSFIDLNWNCKKMLHFLRAPVVPYRWNLAPSAVVSWLCGLEWMNLWWADSIRCYRLWSAVLPGPQEKEEIWMNELQCRLAVAICLTITFDTLINISVDWGCQFQSTVRATDEQLLNGIPGWKHWVANWIKW